MAGKRKRGNSWEYIFKRAGVLEKPLYLSFDDEEEGRPVRGQARRPCWNGESYPPSCARQIGP